MERPDGSMSNGGTGFTNVAPGFQDTQGFRVQDKPKPMVHILVPGDLAPAIQMLVDDVCVKKILFDRLNTSASRSTNALISIADLLCNDSMSVVDKISSVKKILVQVEPVTSGSSTEEETKLFCSMLRLDHDGMTMLTTNVSARIQKNNNTLVKLGVIMKNHELADTDKATKSMDEFI